MINDFYNETMIDEEKIREFINLGYIECKKGWFGRKRYSITQKGKDYLNGKQLEQIRYIQ